MENGQDYKILSTNLSEFFCQKLKDSIRQNKKGTLKNFLFKQPLTQLINGFNLKEDLTNSFPDKGIELETENYVQGDANKVSEDIKSDTKESFKLDTRYNVSLALS